MKKTEAFLKTIVEASGVIGGIVVLNVIAKSRVGVVVMFGVCVVLFVIAFRMRYKENLKSSGGQVDER